MRELVPSEAAAVSGGGIVADGTGCIGGGVAAILGIATAETGVGATIAWAGYVAAAGSCYEFGADLGKLGETDDTASISDLPNVSSYSDYTIDSPSGAVDDYGMVYFGGSGYIDSFSDMYSMGYGS